jgi:hypothetical protein
VAYASRDGRAAGALFVQPFPANGAKYQISKNADDGHHPIWGSGGAELLFIPGAGRLAAVRITTQPSFAIGEQMALPRPFGGTAPDTVRAFDIAPDGQRIVGLFPQEIQSNVNHEILVVLHWTDELKRLVPSK